MSLYHLWIDLFLPYGFMFDFMFLHLWITMFFETLGRAWCERTLWRHCVGNVKDDIMASSCVGNAKDDIMAGSCVGNVKDTIMASSCVGIAQDNIMAGSCVGNAKEDIMARSCVGNAKDGWVLGRAFKLDCCILRQKTKFS